MPERSWSLKGFLTLDPKNFDEGLARTVNKASAAATQVAKVGTKMKEAFDVVSGGFLGNITGLVSITGAVAAFKQLTDHVREIRIQSENLGIGPERMQQYFYAFQKAGLEANDFTIAYAKFGQAVAKANEGNKDAIQLFSKLGITAEDLRSMELEKLFDRTASAIEKMSNKSERLHLNIELFGKKGGRMGAVFSDLSSNMQKAIDKGLVLSEGDMGRVEKLTVRISTLWNSFKNLLGSGMAGVSRNVQSVREMTSEGTDRSAAILAVLLSSFGTDINSKDNILGAMLRSDMVNKKIREGEETMANKRRLRKEREAAKEQQEWNDLEKAAADMMAEQKRLGEIESKISAERARQFMASLTPLEKLIELQSQYVELKEREALTAESQAQKQLDLLRLEGEMATARDAVMNEREGTGGKLRFDRPNVSESLRMGGFHSMQEFRASAMNGNLSDALSIQRESLRTLKTIARELGGDGREVTYIR